MSSTPAILAGWMEIPTTPEMKPFGHSGHPAESRAESKVDPKAEEAAVAIAALVDEYAGTLYRVAYSVLRNAADAASPRVGSSIYGAVQQLCLAARAYGIGTSLTTLYGGHEDELRELLGLPPDALTMALIPMGYPAKGRWAEPRRRPVGEVVHWDHWGAKRSRPE